VQRHQACHTRFHFCLLFHAGREASTVTAVAPAEVLREEEQAQADQEQAAWAAAEAAAAELMAEEDQAQAKQQQAVVKAAAKKAKKQTQRDKIQLQLPQAKSSDQGKLLRHQKLHLQQQHLIHLGFFTTLLTAKQS